MKRLAIACSLLLAGISAYAGVNERDVLVTPDGTVYTAELQNSDDGNGTIIALTTQTSAFTSKSIIPDSQSHGFKSAPALAFDSQSQTLFVFWLRMPNMMSSELLVSPYRNGQWQQSLSVDNKPYCLRFNLRIAVRHRVLQPQSDGSAKDVNALVIHTVWWEQTGNGEVARYALIPIDDGSVRNVELHDLTEFVAPGDPINVDPSFNRDLLKHPALVDTRSPDSVDVVFGDLTTNSLNRVTLRPIADGRIHIPIGHGGGGSRLGVPTSFSADWSGNVAAVVPGYDDGTILLYNVGTSSVNFVLYTNGAWAPPKSIPLNDKLSADAAIAALGRMLSQ